MPLQEPPVAIAEEVREELLQMSVSRTLAPGDIFRARVILMLADGRSYSEIQRRLRTSAPTISRWKKRFVEAGVAGLLQRRSTTRKATALTPELSEQVIAATCHRPPDGSPRWSCRALARELGLSKDIVQRIWRSAGLRPHRLERYMAADAKALRGNAADIVGLYLRPTQHAAVFCNPGNSDVRASWSTRTVPESQEIDWSHHAPQGRLSLYSVLSGASSAKPGKTTRPAKETCVSFLSKVLGGYPAGLRLTVVLDRLSREEIVSVELLLNEYPKTVLLLAPSYSAWLDRMEELCSTGEIEAVPAGTLASLNTLTRKLMGHIRVYAKAKKGLQWIDANLPDRNLY